MSTIDGGSLLVRALREQGVELVFRLLGDPLIGVAIASHREGLPGFDFRHEQGLTMAAQAYGYVRRGIGVGLVASGPAMTKGLLTLVPSEYHSLRPAIRTSLSELSMAMAAPRAFLRRR